VQQGQNACISGKGGWNFKSLFFVSIHLIFCMKCDQFLSLHFITRPYLTASSETVKLTNLFFALYLNAQRIMYCIKIKCPIRIQILYAHQKSKHQTQQSLGFLFVLDFKVSHEVKQRKMWREPAQIDFFLSSCQFC